ncbi:orotate phosphoribosyltransferase [Plasmodium gaboni]|uniref:orotate phosphoribosyltransferase n=1 Tax=Plasmodium gaboni TaxID=647221 RepID=A0A151LT29_9APIC|nr:orotate phosphoribosyltransferase [Plasmodium gaboni]KYO02322.1 orotate phosphoribosyltransferase [Plasmodium gaboni]
MIKMKENEFLCDEEIYKKFVDLKDKIYEERKKKKDLLNSNVNGDNVDVDDVNYDDDTSYKVYILEMKKLLKNVLLKYKALKFGEFILKSKRKSNYFFSSGVLNNIVSSNIICFLLSELIIKKNLSFDYLLGASYKGIPMVSLTSHFLFESKKYSNIFYLYDRKEKKEYGDKNVIVGNLDDDEHLLNLKNTQNNHCQEKKNIIIIDDVFTCGTALTEILEKLKTYENLKVVAFIVLLNRNEYEINENNKKIYFKDIFEKKVGGIPLYSILSYDDDIKPMI